MHTYSPKLYPILHLLTPLNYENAHFGSLDYKTPFILTSLNYDPFYTYLLDYENAHFPKLLPMGWSAKCYMSYSLEG